MMTRRRFVRGAAVVSAAPFLPDGGSPDALDEALERLAATGPEYHGGLANHGPMAAEALVTLGRRAAVMPWVEGYRKRLDARPSESRRIAQAEWREALGARARVGDWSAYFRRAGEERGWKDLLAEWVPRLAPGMVAAAFHGVIRTAQAARALAVKETPARRRELGEGLAYWAANYHTLPRTPHTPTPGRLASRALADVTSVPEEKRVGSGFILHRLAPVESFAPFASAADLADATGDASAFLSDLTATFAGVFLASVPPGSLITFVHSVTGPSAVRLLLPHLDAPARAAALTYAWQGAAAFYSGFGGLAPRADTVEAEPPPREELIDRAVATGDEHAIKFTEACLRENAVKPNGVYVRAAAKAVELLG